MTVGLAEAVHSISDLWPLFNLRVRTPRLLLRYPSDDDLATLARLAGEGIHPPDAMPFVVPWTTEPSPELERGLLRRLRQGGSSVGPTGSNLSFLVLDGQAPVGMQMIHTQLGGRGFARLRALRGSSGAHKGRASEPR